ncbi:MAG: hypothetical protein WCK92_14875 [Bacteroidota bacterium]
MAWLFRLNVLFFIRLFYGPLSSEYYFAILKFRQFYPSTTLQSRVCFKTEVILRLVSLCNIDTKLTIYRTMDSIMYEDSNYGLNYKQICKEKGKPESAKYEWVGEKLIQVICYKDTLLERPVKLNYFLIDDCFFMGEYQFLSYNQTSVDSVRSILQAKYHFQIGPGETRFFINDPDGAFIYFNDSGFNFCLQYYFPGDQGIDQYLKRIIAKSKVPKKSVQVEGRDLAGIL